MNVRERSSAITGAILLISIAACTSQTSTPIPGSVQTMLSQRQTITSSMAQRSNDIYWAPCTSEFVPVLLNGNPETLHGDLSRARRITDSIGTFRTSLKSTRRYAPSMPPATPFSTSTA
jgi:hypothetical protein